MSSTNHWTIQASADLSHPNRRGFKGVLTLVDIASDKSPSGARGHRIIVTHAAAEAALPGLIGMCVDFKADWDGHDARNKCGVITAAKIVGNKVLVEGYVYMRDFPEFAHSAPGIGELGMSYELADAHVVDMRARVWTLNRVTFTGAAILLREKAAYRSTRFELADKKGLYASSNKRVSKKGAQLPDSVPFTGDPDCPRWARGGNPELALVPDYAASHG